MIKPRDYFSEGAEGYKKYRPVYPEALYKYIYTHLDGNACAWDCATGNGQVATALADHFEKVYATDISSHQLEMAPKRENISYEISRAEGTHYPDNHFDLITVGQALHWFDREHFFQEVNRVAKPSGVLAIWGYGLPRICPKVDTLLSEFCNQVLAEYWDFDRSTKPYQLSQESHFFMEIKGKSEFVIEQLMSKAELTGYLYTWSAVKEYLKHNQDDPVQDLMRRMEKVWKGNQQKLTRFSIFLKLRRINK